MSNKPTTAAYEDIFGGSDSELSDVEEDVQQQQGQAIDAGDVSGYDEEDEAAALEAEAERLAGPEGDEDEEDDRGGDADYTDLAKKDVNGLPSFKKDPNRKRNAVDGEERPKKRAKKRVQREEAENVTPPPIDPVAERAAKLDAILQNKKRKGPKRKRKAGEEDLDELADEEVYRLRQLMEHAADADKEAYESNMPAIEKLKLLPEVTAVLQKPHLEQTILEADILTQMRRWLEPIGKAMPALNIQRALLDALTKLDLETSQLKASELGKIILFYTKHPKLDRDVKRTADHLIMAWMRPIIRRSAQARDRIVQRADPNLPMRPAGRSRVPLTAKEKADAARRHASIPQPITAAYTIAPHSRISNDPSMAPKSNARYKGMKARLDAASQDARRM